MTRKSAAQCQSELQNIMPTKKKKNHSVHVTTFATHVDNITTKARLKASGTRVFMRLLNEYP